MQDHQRAIAELDEKIDSSLSELPKALSQIHGTYMPHQRSRHDSLEKVTSEAKMAREQVGMLSERLSQSLKTAIGFSRLIQRQCEFPENLLPPEVLENSGTVVAHLKRADKLSSKLRRDAEELIRAAEVQRAKTAMAPDPMLALLLVRRDRDRMRKFL